MNKIKYIFITHSGKYRLIYQCFEFIDLLYFIKISEKTILGKYPLLGSI